MAGKRTCCPQSRPRVAHPPLQIGRSRNVCDQLKALDACVDLRAVEKDPQQVYAGMVDAAGILEDLAKAMLVAGLAKDENTSDAQD